MYKINPLLLLCTTLCLLYSNTYAEELPLTGPAYIIADDAYKAYERGDYDLAINQAREAIRLRPDVSSLRQLLANAEAARKNVDRIRPSTNSAAPGSTITSISPGFNAAKIAYETYAKGDYSTALVHAKKAIQLEPNNQAYWLLLLNAQLAAAKPEDAKRTLDEAERKFGTRISLDNQKQDIHKILAEREGSKLYAAIKIQDFNLAILHARRAVAYAPERKVYRLLLIESLLNANRIEEAQKEINTLDRGQNDPLLLTLRGYTEQRLDHRSAAIQDFDLALISGRTLPTEEIENIRLIIADAALNAGEADAALNVLQPLNRDGNKAVQARLREAMDIKLRDVETTTNLKQTLPPPVLSCSQLHGVETCTLLPAALKIDPAYALADDAYIALQNKNYSLALNKIKAAQLISPSNMSYRLLTVNILRQSGDLRQAEQEASDALLIDRNQPEMLALRGSVRQAMGQLQLAQQDYDNVLKMEDVPVKLEIEMLHRLGRQEEAHRRFEQALLAGAFDDMSKLELAYLAKAALAPEQSFEYFDQAYRAGDMPASALGDAAFSALQANRDKDAAIYFKRSITAANSGEFAMPPQQLYDMRRAVADIERTWGLNASLNYRGNSISPGYGVTPDVGDDSAQVGAETYWRPFGYRSGRQIELYASIFETIYAKSSTAATGASTMQGGIGIRWKPLSETNLVLAMQRQIKIGSDSAEDDWLARLAYSNSFGTDLRVDTPSWWTGQVFGETGRYINERQTYATYEGEIGRSYLMAGISPNLIVFPHVVFAGDYNSGYTAPAEKNSVTVGPGVHVRYWFREDTYNAPKSYIDVSLQYRSVIAGDERGKGLAFRTAFSF